MTGIFNLMKTTGMVSMAAIVCAFFFHNAIYFGIFKHFHKHYPGKCRKINGPYYGSEDFQVTSDGKAFITSGLNFGVVGEPYQEFLKRHNIKGHILAFDFLKPDEGVTELKIKNNFDREAFRPNGISILEDHVKGEHLIYVINHVTNKCDRIEKFRYLPKSNELEHVKSFFSENFHTTNDLAIIGEDMFYVTNYYYATTALGGILENLGQLPLGSVLFYNGTGAVPVLTSMKGPNGILVSADGRHVYLNLPHQEKMTVYSRNPGTNALTLTQSIHLYTAVDNSHFSQSGDAIFTGCHPIMMKVFDHFNDPENAITPSQVLHLPIRDGKVVADDVIEVFYDHGQLISGSTIATIYNELLLVGSIINSLVICDTNGPLKD